MENRPTAPAEARGRELLMRTEHPCHRRTGVGGFHRPQGHRAGRWDHTNVQGLRIGESSDPDAPARKSMRREGGFPDGEKQVVSEWLRDGCSLSFGAGKQSCGLRSPSANAWHGRQVSQKHQNVPGSWEAWGAPPTLLPLPPQKQDELHSENPVDTS
uniref:uncharacterized protein LOC128928889 isoform X6 n=1 Tax=Callithrix jacchus TaxID=9483 RepID=UPI0023DD2C3C|nr:uncharacterized protein LOC128928889 isoform X6 [Callithrix jacchus]